MILAIVLSALGSSGLTIGGHYLYYRIKGKGNNKTQKEADKLFQLNEPLSNDLWKELKQKIENIEGYFYADAIIKETIKQGYRFTCAQCYDLRSIYAKKWSNWDSKEYVNDLTRYKIVVEIEAEEVVYNLLNNTNDKLKLPEYTKPTNQNMIEEKHEAKVELEID